MLTERERFLMLSAYSVGYQEGWDAERYGSVEDEFDEWMEMEVGDGSTIATAFHEVTVDHDDQKSAFDSQEPK